MIKLSEYLGLLPFEVNVFGRKRNLIVALGDTLYKPKVLEKVHVRGREMDLSGSEHFKILAYATENLYRSFDRSELGLFMKNHLRMGDVFVDVGANLGGYSMMAMDLGFETYAYEPVPELAAVLLRNQHVYGHVRSIALSDVPGTADFFISDENVGGSSLVASKAGWEASGYSRKIEVEVSTLDAQWEAGSIPQQVNLLKIDVEGNEFQVVSGMRQMADSGAVRNIWCEVRGESSDRNPGTYRTVTAFLKERGYTVWKSVGGQLSPFDPEHDDAPQFFDLLYRHES